MAEPNDDPLMREIEEELRQEQLQKLWRAYGKYIIAVAVIVVAVVAGYQGWQVYDRSARTESTDRLIGAAELVQKGDTQAAIDVYAGIAESGAGGTKLLARMQEAALTAESGDHAAAAAAYHAIADDSAVPQSFRDLATILGATQTLDAGKDGAGDVLDRLQPLTDANNVWRHSARELSAVAAIQSGDKDRARELLKAIALDAQAPGGIRSRAEEMLQAIGQ